MGKAVRSDPVRKGNDEENLARPDIKDHFTRFKLEQVGQIGHQ